MRRHFSRPFWGALAAILDFAGAAGGERVNPGAARLVLPIVIILLQYLNDPLIFFISHLNIELRSNQLIFLKMHQFVKFTV